MKKIIYFVIAGLLTCTFLISCSFTAKKGDDGIYAFQAYNTEDEQIRYLMTEIQLEGTLSFEGFGGYGRQTSQVWSQAVELWLFGVRVVNIDRFYRSTKPGTIIVNGVPVVISGIVYDYETDVVLNPRDVILTTDLQPTIEIPASTIVPENTQVPTVGISENLCDNPYWPLISGAYWEYGRDDTSVSEFPRFGSRIEVPSFDANSNTISLLGDTNLGVLRCSNEGIYANIFDLGEGLLLPAIDSVYDGMTWSNGNMDARIWLTSDIFQGLPVDEIVVFISGNNYQKYNFGFGRGIGLISITIPDICMMCSDYYFLQDYSIPQ